MKNIVVYHANCPDGWVSAYIAAKTLGLTDDDLRPVEYGKYTPVMDKACADAGQDGKVYILDFSLSKDDCLKYAQLVSDLIILDHHASAYDNLKSLLRPTNRPPGYDEHLKSELGLSGDVKLPFVAFDINESGATMTYYYLDISDNRLHKLAMYARDRDLWKWELPESKAINAFIGYLDRTIEAFDGLDLSASHCFTYCVTWGKALIGQQKKQVSSAVKRAVKCRYPSQQGLENGRVAGDDYLNGYAVGAYTDHSEIGNDLCNLPGSQFGLVYAVQNDGTVKCSLRSTGCTDICYIVEQLGGGGHKNAAGFAITNLGSPCGDALSKLFNSLDVGMTDTRILVSGPPMEIK